MAQPQEATQSTLRPSFNEVVALEKQLESATPQEVLEFAVEGWGDRLVVASSFGAEDVVLIDMVARINPDARIFTIDTGRLHQETYDVAERLRNRYGVQFEVYFPNHHDVEQMLRAKGQNSFYASIDNRKECCSIRKIEPLRRALSEADAWVTGIRRGQSITRLEAPHVELDMANRGIVKFNPLARWTEEDVWAYIKENDVPYNILHDCGYPSIGCAPCTRAINPDEDLRAGRWWWESADTRECGLHARSAVESSKL